MEITYFDKDVPTVFNDLAALLLQYIAGIALLVLVAGGVYFMTAGGNPVAQKRAKLLISYCIFGLIIVVLSYSLIKVVEDVGVN